MKEDEPSPARSARRRKLKVAIDGPAGAGKTTIGEDLARLLDVPLLDTGLMYRAVTRAAQDHAIDPADTGAVQRTAEGLTFLLEGSSDATRLTANGRILDTIELHRPEIDREVSVIAANAGLRKALVTEQRRMARGIPIVMLGRDIGTVVLPDAELKLFVTATPAERATRRVAQRQVGAGSGDGVQVLEELTLRDERDSMREVSPLRPAADSIVIDTTGRSVAESATAARELVLTALARLSREAE